MRTLATEAAPPERLDVRFPLRIARFGLLFFGTLLALFTGWVRNAPEMPWLAVVAGTGCFLGVMLSLRQIIWPKRLATADREGLTIFSRRLEGGEQHIAWSEVLALSYEERQVGQWIHKVVRLEMGRPVDASLRQMPDDETVAHLDAFAAEPGGRELLAHLEQLRPKD